MTSATTSCTRCLVHRLVLGLIKRLAAKHRRIDDADDHRIGGEILGLLGHAGAAALHDQDELPFAAADDIDGDDRPAGVAERSRASWSLRRISH